MRFLRASLLSLVAFVAVSTPAFAQDMTSIVATSTNSGDTPLANGQLCFVGVDQYGTPITFTKHNGGTYLRGRPTCQTITAGALAGALSVPNALLTQPANICYAITISDASNNQTIPWGISCGVDGTSFDLDTANPGGSGVVPVSGFKAANGVPTAACVAPSFYVQLDATAGSNIWSCISGTWTQQWTGRLTHGTKLIQTGDSITYGLYLGSLSSRYGQLMANDYGLANSVYTRAVPGEQACDIWPNQIWPNLSTDSPISTAAYIYTTMPGTNDVGHQGVGAYESIFNACQRAYLSYLAIPDVNKVLAGSANLTVLSGSNSTALDSLYNNSTGSGGYQINAFKLSVAGTNRAQVTTTGNPIFVWYAVTDTYRYPNSPGVSTDPGHFSISIDGGTPIGPIATQLPLSDGTDNGMGSFVFPAGPFPVSAGVHTVDFIWVDGTVGIVGVGSPPTQPLYSMPTVAVGTVPNQRIGDGPSSPANIAQYNADVASNVSWISQYTGVDVRLCQNQTFMLGTSAEMANNVHPNELGDVHLAQAYESCLQASPTQSNASNLVNGTLARANGGTGADTSALPSGCTQFPCVVAKVAPAIYSSTASTSLATLYTPVAAGQFNLCGWLSVSAVGTAGSATLLTNFTTDGFNFSGFTIGVAQGSPYSGHMADATVSATAANQISNACMVIYADAGQPIKWQLGLNAVTGSPTFRYSLTLEQLQ